MIDREQVHHVARLARLQLTDDEVERMSGELSSILGHIERISELDLEGVEPTSHVVEFGGADAGAEPSGRAHGDHSPAEAGLPLLSNALRADEPRPSLDREVALANAPDRTEDGFLVPSPQAG